MSAAAALLLALVLQEGAVRHSARVEPTAGEVGRPFLVVAEVQHPEGLLPRALEPEWDASAPWVTLDTATERVDARRTRLAWRIVGLEPDLPAAPELGFTFRDASGPHEVAVAFDAPALAGVLAEGEDAPRPLRPFRALAPGSDAASRRTARLAALAAVLLFGLVVLPLAVRAWRLRRARPGAAPSAAERLARLADQPGAPRARRAALATLVREALDERAGADRRGLTDDEWVAAIAADPGLDEARRSAARELVAGAREVKYAGRVPTDFALAEALERARRVLAAEGSR